MFQGRIGPATLCLVHNYLPASPTALGQAACSNHTKILVPHGPVQGALLLLAQVRSGYRLHPTLASPLLQQGRLPPQNPQEPLLPARRHCLPLHAVAEEPTLLPAVTA